MKDTPEDRERDGSSRTDEASIDAGRSEEEWSLAAQQHYDPESEGGLTTTIVSAIAEADGVSSRDVRRPPLYEVVDTAALETAFFGRGAPSGDVRCRAEFDYREYRVVVRDDGWVLVHEPSDR